MWHNKIVLFGLGIAVLGAVGGGFWYMAQNKRTLFPYAGVEVRIPRGIPGQHKIVASIDHWKIWQISNMRRARTYLDEEKTQYQDKYYVWAEIIRVRDIGSFTVQMEDGDQIEVFPMQAQVEYFNTRSTQRRLVGMYDKAMLEGMIGKIVYVEWHGKVQTDPLVDELLNKDGTLTEFASNVQAELLVFPEE